MKRTKRLQDVLRTMSKDERRQYWQKMGKAQELVGGRCSDAQLLYIAECIKAGRAPTVGGLRGQQDTQTELIDPLPEPEAVSPPPARRIGLERDGDRWIEGNQHR